MTEPEFVQQQGPTRTEAPTRHVAHIDGLRAIAVLAVIAHHLRDSWLPGGFVGVDVFFVISGFVVSQSVSRREGDGLASFLAYFYARRMQRIVPALLACLLLTTLATTLFVPAVWLGQALAQTGAFAFFGVSNFFLAWNRENYFSPTLDYNPYMHTWSLGVEEQFYLLFPLLFFAWTKTGRWRAVAVSSTVVALGASFAYACWLGRHDATAAFYLIFSRLWELAAGVVLFQAFGNRNPKPSKAGGAIAWCGGLLLCFTLVDADVPPFPAPTPLLSVFATCALIGGLHFAGPASVLARALASRPMTWVGRTSYSLYLWHWPVFTLMRWTCGLESMPQMACGLLLTFALAITSARYVERPFRYSARLRHWPRYAVIAGGMVMVVASWALARTIDDARSHISFSVVTNNVEDWHSNPTLTLPERPGCLLKGETSATGDVKSIRVNVFSRTGCAPPASPPPRIIVMGDSHATALWKMLTQHVLLTGATVVIYQNDGCTFTSLQPEREGGLCPQGNAAAVSHMLAHAEPGDTLLLASLRVSRWTNQFSFTDEAFAWQSMTSASALAARQRATEAAIGTLAPITAEGIRVILLAPTPILRATPYRCADWFNARNPICAKGLEVEREEIERYRRQVIDSFATIVARVPSTYVWDVLPILCPGSICKAFQDGRPLYADGDHLSGHANVLLLPHFEQFLSSLPAPTPRPAKSPIQRLH